MAIHSSVNPNNISTYYRRGNNARLLRSFYWLGWCLLGTSFWLANAALASTDTDLLRAEIARCQAQIEKKKAGRQAADALFGSPPG